MRSRWICIILFTMFLFGFGVSVPPRVVGAQFTPIPIFQEINVDDELGESDGVEIADIDHDGLNELVWLGSWFSGDAHHTLRYYDNESGTLTGYDILDVPMGWEMDTGDVDNDGQVEIAWGAYSSFENEVRVYDYVDDNWVEYNITDISGPLEEVAVHHVAIGDVDNDGLNELAVGLSEHSYVNQTTRPDVEYTVRYYKNESGGWNEYLVGDTDYPVEVVVIGDLDNDGENELLFGIRSSFLTPAPIPNELRYYDYETGGWVEHIIADLPNDIGSRSVKIGDIDNDGLNEVVVGTVGVLAGESEGPPKLGYFKYIGGSWIEYSIVEVGVSGVVEIGDIDNDGHNEVAIGCNIPDPNNPPFNYRFELRYYKPAGNLWFEYVIASPNVTVFSVAIGDLDNDDQNEVAIGLLQSDTEFELRYYELTDFVNLPTLSPWLVIGVIIVSVVVALVVGFIVYMRRKR